jgi:class 3 adenylate cyclase/tetratricopeptide (TPR) repeat protein
MLGAMPTCASCGVELPEGASFCPACGAGVEPAERPGEMLKLVTVLFADVVGSTARAEALDPEDTRSLMADFFDAMSGEIRAEGGTIEKYIGDAIMAVFGVPQAHEDDPVRAVRAARRMSSSLESWNETRPADMRIEIRIGINSGDVLAAGSPGQDLLVTGDAVNVAARLQQAATPGEIVIGERTGRSAEAWFELRPHEPLELKGKSERVIAFTVGRERDDVQTRGVPGLHAPMVGRARELDVLDSTFARCRDDGAPQLVTIFGDAGVGKSRLVQELVATLGVDTKVVVGRCLAYGEGITLWPLGEILKAEAVLLENDPLDVASEKVNALVEGVIGSDDQGRMTAALLATLGLEPPELALLDPQAVYRAMIAAWRALLTALAAEQPLLVVVEDIHWADSTMLDILEDLAEHVASPALVLCTARADLLRTRPGWGGGKLNFSSISLSPLTHDEGAQLVEHLLDVEELPTELKERILARADGNPFFLEEILRRLIDQELLTRDSGRWRAGEGIADVEIPDTVQGVILARIDLLSPAEKRVLQRAAVVGRVFWSGAVQRLTGEASLDAILETLCRRELCSEHLSSSMANDVEYSFKHVLVRDVAYESLPRSERGAAHAEAAAWIEEASGDRVADVAELLAYHYDVAFTLSGDDAFRERARGECLAAGRAAMRRFAMTQALRLGSRAVELSSPGRERGEALEALGFLSASSGNGDDAWRWYNEALVEVTDDPVAVGRLAAIAAITATRWYGSMHNHPSRDELHTLIDAGLAAVGEDDGADRVRLLSSRAFMQTMLYEAIDESSAAAAREAVEIARRIHQPDLLSAALDAEIATMLDDGRYGEIHDATLNRLELVPLLTDDIEIGDCFAMAAWSACFVGLYREALGYSTACIERHAERPSMLLHGSAWRVLARFYLGDWDGALADQAEIEHIEEGDPRDLPVGYAMRAYAVTALIRELRGERDEADRFLDLVRRFAERRTKDGAPSGHVSHALRAFAHQGRLDEARVLMPYTGRNSTSGQVLEALCEVAAGDDGDEAAHIVKLARAEAAECGLLALPFHADRLEGRVTSDRELLRRSADGFASLGAPWEEGWSRLLLAEVTGDAEEARTALAVFERLGSVSEIERAQALLVASA